MTRSTLTASPASRPPTSSSKPRPSSYVSELDDAACEATMKLGDALARNIEALEEVINLIAASTIAQPRYNRRKAKRLLGRVSLDIVRIYRELAEPIPPYRKGVGNPVPIVRYRRLDPEVEGVADFVPTPLPSALVEVSR